MDMVVHTCKPSTQESEIGKSQVLGQPSIENDIPSKWNLKQAGVAILVSDNMYLKTKTVR
jgi:hypothetical protein